MQKFCFSFLKIILIASLLFPLCLCGQESLASAMENAKSDTERIHLLLQKGDELFAKDPAGASPFYEQAASLAFATGNKKEFAKSLYYRGLSDFETGRYYGAIAWMNHARMVEGNEVPDRDLNHWIDSALVLTGQSTQDFDVLWEGIEDAILQPAHPDWLTTSNDTLNNGMRHLKRAVQLYREGMVDSSNRYLDSCLVSAKLFKPNQLLLFDVLNYRINRVNAPCKSLTYAGGIFEALRAGEQQWLIPSFLRNWKLCGIQCTEFKGLPMEAVQCSDSLWMAGLATEEEELQHLGNWLSKTADLAAQKETEASEEILPRNKILFYGLVGLIFLMLLCLIFLWRKKREASKPATAIPVKAEEPKPVAVPDDGRLEQELKKKEQEISRARALIEKQEMEFSIYADEIRSLVVNALVQSRQGLDQLAREVGQSLPVEKYMQVGNEINRSVQILRSFSTEFEASGNLIENLRHCAATFALHRMTIQVQVTGTPKKMDGLRERILFRAMRELMSNAVKHSGASEIKLIIHYTDRECELILTDNGRGFDVNKSVHEGSGLQVVVARLTFIRSELDIESKPGEGTRINIKSKI